MTATQFTDDAYNKLLKGNEAGNGTLVGNWYEEVCQREGSTGEGRCVAQRHIRRSGLLRDFTRVPTDGLRKMDNTFERLYGHRKYEIQTTSAAEVGKRDGTVHVTALNSEPVQASLRLPQVGVKEQRDRVEYYTHAKEYVAAVQEGIDELRQRRELVSSSAAAYTMPPPSDGPAHPRLNVRRELLSGPPLPESELYRKQGVDIDKSAHYTIQEPVTANTEFASNPESRAAMNLTPTINGFRRDYTFSVPTERFLKGPEKDSAEPPRVAPSIPLAQRNVLPPQETSLIDVKAAIAAKYVDAHGPRAWVELRHALEGCAQSDATVTLGDAVELLATPDVHEVALKTYLKQMATMAKDRIQIGKVMTSLRPSIPNARMQAMARLFQATPHEGSTIDLAAWAVCIPAGSVRDQVSADLGVPADVEAAVQGGAGLVLGKDSLLEYLGDLSAAMSDGEFAEYCAALSPA